jgi:hypothetical protein
MKKNRFLLLLALPFMLYQCKDDDKLPSCPGCEFSCLEGNEEDVFSNDCKANWDCHFNIFQQSQIEYNESAASIKEGSQLVFEAILETKGADEIADDEFTYRLYFEIDPAQESFTAEAHQLDLLNIRYQEYCFCQDVNFKLPASGCVQGYKIDENFWKIQANLVIDYSYGPQEVKLEAVYELQ